MNQKNALLGNAVIDIIHLNIHSKNLDAAEEEGFRNWFRSTGLFGWQRAKRNMPAWGKDQTENSAEQEKQALKNELENLQNQAQRIEQRLQDLESSD